MKCTMCGKEMIPIFGEFISDGKIRIYKWRCDRCGIVHDESKQKE